MVMSMGTGGITQLEGSDQGVTAIIAIRSLQKDFFAGSAADIAELRESGDVRHPPAPERRDSGTTMLCDTCRWTERPGFIRRPAATGPQDATADQIAAFIPCPDCGGQAIAHCCEGLCEQPETEA
jgi:hypothetical protein